MPESSPSERRNWGYLSGAAFALLWIVGQSWPTALEGAPTGTGQTDFVSFYSEYEGIHVLAGYLSALGAIALIFFAIRLQLLSEPSSARRQHALQAQAGGVAAAILLLASSAFPFAAAAKGLDQETGRVLWELYNAMSSLGFLVAALFVYAVSRLCRRSTVAGRWVYPTGLPLSILLLVPFLWWASAKLFLFWIFFLSLSLTRRSRSAPSNQSGTDRKGV